MSLSYMSLATRAASVLFEQKSVSYNKKRQYVYNFIHYPLLIP
jgi:hypothetical protein